MSTSYFLTFFTFSVLICLLLCTAAADVLQNEKTTETGNLQSDTAGEALFQETFTQLRGMFKNPILDEDFKTLKQVINANVYLDFLKQTYRIEKPFETLKDFIAVASPPKDKYQDFLNQHFENVTEADFQALHLLTLNYRKTDIIMMHADQTKDRKAMQDAIQGKISIFKKGPISTWFKNRMSGQNHGKRVAFLLSVENFTTKTQKADTDWIQAQFKAHGQDDGLLRIALQKPILIDEIVSNFLNTDLFLKWVEQTHILEKLTVLE